MVCMCTRVLWYCNTSTLCTYVYKSWGDIGTVVDEVVPVLCCYGRWLEPVPADGRSGLRGGTCTTRVLSTMVLEYVLEYHGILVAYAWVTTGIAILCSSGMPYTCTYSSTRELLVGNYSATQGSRVVGLSFESGIRPPYYSE